MAKISPLRIQTGRRGDRGFTLLEIMVVIVILGILVAFVAPSILSNPEKARVTKAKSDLNTIESALDMYKLDNYRYPTTDQGLAALVKKPTTDPIPPNWRAGGYLKSMPVDPWGHPYEYLAPQDSGGRPIVKTLGADGQPGGDGPDADISNLDLK